MVSVGQKLKSPKRYEKRLYKHIRDILRIKNGSEKQLIFEKWEDFENCKNGHYAKATLWKTVSLG